MRVSPAPVAVWARCVRGLEDVVALEAHTRFGARVVESSHRSVILSVEPRHATGLRTADDAYALAGIVGDLSHERASLMRLRDAVRALSLETAVAARASLSPTGKAPAGIDVTASFLGRRNYNRFEIEDAVGDALATMLGLPYFSRADGARPPPGCLAWRVHIEADRAHIGLRLTGTPLHRRAYKVRAPAGTLHPPVAAALVLVADVRTGQTVVDPTCGAGTILIECAVALDHRVATVGVDIDATVLAAAAVNCVEAGASTSLVRADAADLPLTRGGVDRLVANLPWGRQAPLAGALAAGDGLWSEIVRVVAPGGVVAVLTEGPVEADDVHDDLALVSATPLSVMGAHPVVSVLRRR